MLEEAGISHLLPTDEFTTLSIQTIQNWHGMGTVKPRAYLAGHETYTPGHSTVPEARHRIDLSGRGSEFNGKFSFRCSDHASAKGVFPTTPEWDGLGICGDCQQEKAECVN